MRQKGFGKKVLSLALAAAMSVSLCAPAWAEGVTGSSAGSGTTNSQQEQVDGEEGSAFDDEKQQNTDSVVDEGGTDNNVSEGGDKQNANSATDSNEEKENTADSDSTGAGAESSSDAEEQQNNYSAENELLSNEVLGIAAVNETDGESVAYVASVGEQGYTTLQDAIDYAADNATVTLEANVALDNMLVINKAVTLDLMGKTISASGAFQKDNSANNNHLVDIRASGVTIKNGVLEAGSNNNHTLNVYKASNVILQELTLDNTNTYGGAPLIVGSSDVTLAGNMNFITGEKSWYSVNVDGTYNRMTLTFKENAKVALGTSPLGIQVDSSKADKMVTLDFKSGVTVTGSSYPLVLNTQADNHPSEAMKVTGLGDTNLTETQIAGAVAKIGNCYYDTLASAIKNVADNETITLLCDVPEAEGVSVASGKEFTVDFASHTYTVSRPGAGSTNTETNAFQLLKDSTITFRNGTLRISEKNLQPGAGKQIMRLIQNYADLTLENMQIYAANQAGGENYVLSFNNGNITFKGNTSIYMSDPASAIAFDVYYWASSYPNGTKVTFTEDYTGTIQGNIVYDSTDKAKATLTIQGNGGFQGIKLSDGTKNGFNVSVSGGHFVNDPSAYVAEDKMAVTSDKDGYNYKVVTEEDTAAEVVSGDAAVENPAANDATATDDEKKLATDLGSDLDELTVESGVLNATANAVANENKTTKEAGEAALQKAGITISGTDTVSIVIQPYLDIELEKTSIEGEKKSFQLDITPMYRTVATTADIQSNEGIVVSGEETGSDSANAVVMGKPAKLNVTKPVEMTIQLPSDFAAKGTTLYVLHQKDDGRRYQYVGTVNDKNVLTFTNPNGFSVFTISTQEFDLSTNDTTDSSNTTTTPAATPAPTAAPQQSGSNITYYTCQACGYHDWTATAEGYKCNHCGYIESVKQLSGYGNVKGVYEPKTSTAAAQTGAAASGTVSSAIPQTGDEQPIAALVVVAVAALLGLGVTVVMKKRNNG